MSLLSAEVLMMMMMMMIMMIMNRFHLKSMSEKKDANKPLTL